MRRRLTPDRADMPTASAIPFDAALLTRPPPAVIINQMVNHEAHLDRVFSALADPTRRAIVARLAAGESSVSELAAPFAMTLPAVSKHLRVLESAGLVARDIDGRVHRCRLVARPLDQAMSWLATYRAFGELQVDALAGFRAEERPPPRRRKPAKSRSK